MNKQICFGIYGTGHYASLATPDKQLHVGPTVIGNLESAWVAIANTLAFLEGECPSETFTLVLDDPWAFRNPSRGQYVPEEKKKKYVNLAGTVKVKSSFKHKRVPDMQKAADAFAERLFGIPLSKAKAEAICIECRKPIDLSGWDEREKSEYEISGLCRKCQEIMFAALDDEMEDPRISAKEFAQKLQNTFLYEGQIRCLDCSNWMGIKEGEKEISCPSCQAEYFLGFDGVDAVFYKEKRKKG